MNFLLESSSFTIKAIKTDGEWKRPAIVFCPSSFWQGNQNGTSEVSDPTERCCCRNLHDKNTGQGHHTVGISTDMKKKSMPQLLQNHIITTNPLIIFLLHRFKIYEETNNV